jgi:hypothetical protein
MDGAQWDGCDPMVASGQRRTHGQPLPGQLELRGGWALSDASDQPRPGSKKNVPSRGASRRSLTEPGWDRWLDRQIHQLYDPVLNEAIPAELRELLMRFDEKPPEGDESK